MKKRIVKITNSFTYQVKQSFFESIFKSKNAQKIDMNNQQTKSSSTPHSSTTVNVEEPIKQSNQQNKDLSIKNMQQAELNKQFQNNNQNIIHQNRELNKFIMQQQQQIKSLVPSFEKLEYSHILDRTGFSPNLQLYSPFRWTPLIQVQDTFSPEFQNKMKYFKKLRYFEPEHENELIDCLIYEAIKNTDFDYYYNYNAKPSRQNIFHGNIDFLIYNKKSSDRTPYVPVIRSKKVLNKAFDQQEDYFNLHEAIGAGLWALINMKASNKSIDKVRVLITNGNIWRMIQITEQHEFEKTGYYIPKDINKKIYMDVQAQCVALGLIKFALNSPNQNEQALKKIYDFIDERRYLTEMDAETKNAINKQQKFWWFLPRPIREFFFKLN